jgi:hypothetical protein
MQRLRHIQERPRVHIVARGRAKGQQRVPVIEGSQGVVPKLHGGLQHLHAAVDEVH